MDDIEGVVNSAKRFLRCEGSKPYPLFHKETKWASSGSTLINLICSDHPSRAFLAGHYYLLVGDSDSGKTFIALNTLAEVARDPAFEQYRIIYDAVECGALMDLSRFFGPELLSRIEPPAKDKEGNWLTSVTVQDFYLHLDDAFRNGKPFLYVLDSQDCLSSDEEIKQFRSYREARFKDRESSGSYGDAKAKYHSANLRRVVTSLLKSRSILIVISQTRDTFDMFTPATFSGGRALTFYATLVMWLRLGAKIKKVVNGKERQLGIISRAVVKKNRLSGKEERPVNIRIYHSYGIDDTGSMVDYLISEGVWKSEGNRVKVEGLGQTFSSTIEKVIEKIEGEGLVDKLQELVCRTWYDIESKCMVRRKPRFQISPSVQEKEDESQQ